MGNLMDYFSLEDLESLNLNAERTADNLMLSMLIRTDHIFVENQEIKEFLDKHTADRMLLWQFSGQDCDDNFDYIFVWYNDQDQIFEINKVVNNDGDPRTIRLYNLDASMMHHVEFYRTISLFDTIEHNKSMPCLNDILVMVTRLDLPE
ncbi:hypothetical protein [Enterococcus sp. DIV0187]|uniref:hypothetical protein n=1 Tax=Enterococcus sp. DIV0187 TaxID=2774644 RepID=UPI003F2762FB